MVVRFVCCVCPAVSFSRTGTVPGTVLYGFGKVGFEKVSVDGPICPMIRRASTSCECSA